MSPQRATTCSRSEMKPRQSPSSAGGSDLSRSEMKSRQNPSPIGDRILSRSEMLGRDLAPINPSEASYLRNRLTETDGWFEESKKINDAILSYEKMNDTAYFNQSTISDESKDESNAFLSDSKDGSEDAVFNESFRFTDDNSRLSSGLWKILGRSGSKMWDESTDESEDPSGTLSGENEDGSESFESANESHNPCNESNINRVMDDFKSEVMGELLEIKGEMKKKDNIILDLLGRLDANQGQQNGQTRQSTSPAPTGTQILQPQGTNQGQQTARTNQSQQSYASVTGLPVVGLHVDPRQGNRQNGGNNQRQQSQTRNQRQQSQTQNQRQTNNNNQGRPTQKQHTYEIIGRNGLIERVTEWKTIPFKSKSRIKREQKRHLEDLEQVEKEVVLHGIPTLKNGVPDKKSDEARVKKILRELRPGGFVVKNGDVEGSKRQIRNTRNIEKQPITITLRTAELADQVRASAYEVGILNTRMEKPDNLAKDRIGWLRRSLTQKERKKIRARAEFENSEQGKSLREIQRREDEQTTDQEEWSGMNLETDDGEEDMDMGDPDPEK